MTARDVQAKAKKAGLPWTQAKGYDTFTPVSDFIPKEDVPSPENLNLWLKVRMLITDDALVAQLMSFSRQVDDELRQNGSTSDMVHSIPFLISYISRIMTLEEGDLIITGTPEGVGPVPPNSVRVLTLCHPAPGFTLMFVHLLRAFMSRRSRQVSPASLR